MALIDQIRALVLDMPLTYDVLLAISVCVFLAFTTIAFLHTDNQTIRKSYISYLFVGIVIVGVVSIEFIPFIHWLKFSEVPAQEQTSYEIRLVDETGHEIPYDSNAIEPLNDVQTRTIAATLNERTEEEKELVLGHLFQNACEYRDKNRDSIVSKVKFPPHALDYRWNHSELDKRPDFKQIAAYKITIRSNTDGTDIIQQNESKIINKNISEFGPEVKRACL